MMERFIVFTAQCCTSCRAKWVIHAPSVSLFLMHDDVSVPAVALATIGFVCVVVYVGLACLCFLK